MVRRTSVTPLRAIATYLVVLWFGCVGTAYPANTYKEPGGKFAVDLPEGWNLTPQTPQQRDENVYVFKGGGLGQFILTFLPGPADKIQLFSLALDLVRQNMADASPEGEIVDLEVNGNPARWGVYHGTYAVAEGRKVILIGLVGGLALQEGGVEFLSILNEPTRKRWGSEVEKAFQSIRKVGSSVTGVSKARPVRPAELAKTSEPAQPTPSAPKIQIMDPPVKAEGKPVEVTESPITIRGAAMDDRGILGVQVNGQQAVIKSTGDIRSVEFSLSGLALQEGLNRVSVIATNIDKQTSETVLPIWWRKTAPASPSAGRKGLTESEITDLLKNSVPPQRIAELGRDKGVGFDVTPQVEERLRRAGADDGLVQTLRDLSSKKP